MAAVKTSHASVPHTSPTRRHTAHVCTAFGFISQVPSFLALLLVRLRMYCPLRSRVTPLPLPPSHPFLASLSLRKRPLRALAVRLRGARDPAIDENAPMRNAPKETRLSGAGYRGPREAARLIGASVYPLSGSELQGRREMRLMPFTSGKLIVRHFFPMHIWVDPPPMEPTTKSFKPGTRSHRLLAEP